MSINIKAGNSDASLTMKSNYSIKKWERYLTKKVQAQALKDIRTYMKAEMTRRFKTARGPTGQRWPKADRVTSAGRRGQLMLRRQRLLKSLKFKISKGKLVIETKSIYARLQEKGAKYRTTVKQSIWMWWNLYDQDPANSPFTPRNIVVPPRPFLGFSQKNRKEFDRIYRKHIKKSERIGK